MAQGSQKQNPNGPWKVLGPANDDGGRRELGFYSGPIDRVALAVVSKLDSADARYDIEIIPLRVVDANAEPVTVRKALVMPGYGIQFDWASLLAGRPARISSANGTDKTVTIEAGPGYDKIIDDSIAALAVAKLSPQEFNVLRARGLNI